MAYTTWTTSGFASGQDMSVDHFLMTCARCFKWMEHIGDVAPKTYELKDWLPDPEHYKKFGSEAGVAWALKSTEKIKEFYASLPNAKLPKEIAQTTKVENAVKSDIMYAGANLAKLNNSGSAEEQILETLVWNHQRLEYLSSLTDKQKETKFEEYMQALAKEESTKAQACLEVCNRGEAMIACIEAWRCPKEFAEVKELALDAVNQRLISEKREPKNAKEKMVELKDLGAEGWFSQEVDIRESAVYGCRKELVERALLTRGVKMALPGRDDHILREVDERIAAKLAEGQEAIVKPDNNLSKPRRVLTR